MDAPIRRMLAYLATQLASDAASLASAPDRGLLYDYHSASYSIFAGKVSPKGCSLFDYGSKTHYFAKKTAEGYAVYPHATGNLIRFDEVVRVAPQVARFKGLDLGTSQYFAGVVRGRSVSFYDYQSSKFFNYAVP